MVGGSYPDAMPTKLTTTDEGKDVVSPTGERIGLVKDVDDGAAHVDPNPGITDELKAKLGWGDSDGDTYRLRETDVETVTDDEVRLGRGL